MRFHASRYSVRSRRGQNTMEYLLIATAVAVVLIVAVLVRGGVFVQGTESVLDFPGDRVDRHRTQMNFTTTY